MSALAKMRQLEERQVEKEIEGMLWSPKMDIIALRWKDGQEVSLFRLNWQKLWTAGPPTEASRSTGMIWRPDGKLLAIGYNSSHVSILDVESHIPLYNHMVDGPVSCLSWTLFSPDILQPPETKDDTEREHATKEMLSSVTSGGWEFLTSFPSLSKAYTGSEDREECQKLHDGGIITLLAVGTNNGFIHLFMNGFLPCSKIDLNLLCRQPCSLESVSMSPTQFATFSATYRPRDESNPKDEEILKLVTFSVPLLATCTQELKIISKYFCVIKGILAYMSETLKQIKEAWESVLLEMDSKLESYAQKLPEDGMAADFLELLMFGKPSPELESFLQTELTEKGLKKFDHSIEVSYSNIHRLVLSYLNVVSQSLNFHLAELVGHCRVSNKFIFIGVQEENIIEAERCAAVFWALGIEVQQVLDESLRSFKAFFKWISVEIRRLSELFVPDDQTKVSQQEVRFIAEFLNSFSTSYNKDKNLEKVGQYLKDDVLTQPLFRLNNPWYKFLQDNPDVKDLPFIIWKDDNTSPLREFDRLQSSIDSIFSGVNVLATDHCQMRGEFMVPNLSGEGNLPVRMSNRQFECLSTGKILGLVLHRIQLEPDARDRESFDKLLFYEVDPSAAAPSPLRALWLSLEMDSGLNKMKLIDCQFYTSEMISLLFENEEHQRLIQLNYSLMEPHLVKVNFSPDKCLDITSSSITTRSVFDFSDQSCHRDLEHLLSDQFAVSGPRKVAAFLFRNKRRIRIYDMEAEEEDLEDDTLGTSGISSELNTST